MEPAQNGQGRQDPPQEPGLLKERDHDFLLRERQKKRHIRGSVIITTKVAWQPSFRDYTMSSMDILDIG
jgi:hypothetical protein